MNKALLAALLICFCPAAAIAADNQPGKPAPDEISSLRAEIERLQAKVQTLEDACPAPSAHQPASGKGRRYLSKWRWDKLETGMEMEEVRALLGGPSNSTRSAAGQVEIWGYGDPQANRFATGTIYFDEDNEVTTWISPTFKTD